jgi:hypothetical protein
MDTLYNAFVAHPALFLSIWTGAFTLFQWVFSAYASSLRAPTSTSTQNYVSWFAIVNTVAGNLARINPPKVENSPNFEAAVNLQQKMAGQPATPVQVPPTVEDSPKP